VCSRQSCSKFSRSSLEDAVLPVAASVVQGEHERAVGVGCGREAGRVGLGAGIADDRLGRAAGVADLCRDLVDLGLGASGHDHMKASPGEAPRRCGAQSL
jgi:hypothetical protein